MISEIVNSPYVAFKHSYVSVKKFIHFYPNIEVSSSFTYSLAKFSGKDQTLIVLKQKKWILTHFGITKEKGKMFSNCIVFTLMENLGEDNGRPQLQVWKHIGKYSVIFQILI